MMLCSPHSGVRGLVRRNLHVRLGSGLCRNDHTRSYFDFNDHRGRRARIVDMRRRGRARIVAARRSWTRPLIAGDRLFCWSASALATSRGDGDTLLFFGSTPSTHQRARSGIKPLALLARNRLGN